MIAELADLLHPPTAWRRLRRALGSSCWEVLPLAAFVVLIGIVLQWSVAGAGPLPRGHLVRVLAAALVAAFAASRPPRTWSRLAPALWVGVLVLLVLVLVVGREVNGARRWLFLPGGVSLQPSEFLKPVLILLWARGFAERPRPRRLADLARPAAALGLGFVLVLVEPDLGTALSLLPLFLGMVWLAGAPRRVVRILLLAPLVLAPLAWPLLHGYQRERIQTWWQQDALTPEQRAAEGYHLWHAKLAVGSGGWEGMGWGRGPENRLDRLPERTNDFVFPVLAEEGGFRVAVPFLTAYLLLGLALLRRSARHRDPFVRLALAGCGLYFLVHLVVNVGVTLGVLPTTGLPLPLVSLGGSSMVAAGWVLGLAWSLAGVRAAPLSSRAFEED